MALYLGNEKIDRVSVSFVGSEGGIDTSDATATVSDIASGKTAYVNGEKITGNITTSSGSKIYQLTPSIMENTNVLLSAHPYSQKYIVDENTSVLLLSSLSNFGDAAPEDVVAGKTFTSTSGLVVTGTHQCSGGSEPTLQSKTVIPSESQQIISPDAGYDGLSSVTVDAIPSEYEIPSVYSGSYTITSNGTINTQGKKLEQDLVIDIPSSAAQNYYTGTDAPDASLGSDGDLYLKTEV